MFKLAAARPYVQRASGAVTQLQLLVLHHTNYFLYSELPSKTAKKKNSGHPKSGFCLSTMDTRNTASGSNNSSSRAYFEQQREVLVGDIAEV